MITVVSETQCTALYDLIDAMWSGGKENMEALADACDRGLCTEDNIFQCINDYCADEDGKVGETTLNDFVWFEIDTICDYLGITEEELYNTEEDDKEEE